MWLWIISIGSTHERTLFNFYKLIIWSIVTIIWKCCYLQICIIETSVRVFVYVYSRFAGHNSSANQHQSIDDGTRGKKKPQQHNDIWKKAYFFQTICIRIIIHILYILVEYFLLLTLSAGRHTKVWDVLNIILWATKW